MTENKHKENQISINKVVHCELLVLFDCCQTRSASEDNSWCYCPVGRLWWGLIKSGLIGGFDPHRKQPLVR